MLNFFKKVLGWLTGGATKAASLVQRIATDAMPIIREIAALTPTRVDDEIVALFDRYAVPNADKWLALPVEDRGAALLHVATSEMEKRWPTQTHVLQLAIQLALTQLRLQ